MLGHRLTTFVQWATNKWSLSVDLKVTFAPGTQTTFLKCFCFVPHGVAANTGSTQVPKGRGKREERREKIYVRNN